MRRTIIVLAGALGSLEEESSLRQRLPALGAMAELGSLCRLAPTPEAETREVVWLGLDPSEAQLREGPLTVAAFGADPPLRSTHFHVSLLGCMEGEVHRPPAQVGEADLRAMLTVVRKLNTRTLTLVEGEGLDHGLVWENVGDLATTPASEAIGGPLCEHLPQGDAEVELRRFIDDSINLLGELEMNERRLDEGQVPLNLLWPWGHGVRTPVPNLFLKRGERAHVASGSLRMAGLARLVGYRHGDRSAFGKGMNTRLERLASVALVEPVSVLVLDAPAELRSEGKNEELHWFVRQVDERLLAPLFEATLRESARIVVIASGSVGGLGVSFETGMHRQNSYPFDERSLEENALRRLDAWQVVADGLRPPPAEELRRHETEVRTER